MDIPSSPELQPEPVTHWQQAWPAALSPGSRALTLQPLPRLRACEQLVPQQRVEQELLAP